MARDFTKNVANYLTIGVDQLSPLLAGAAAVSVHAWINPDTFSTSSNNNRIVAGYINAGSSGFSLSIHNGTSAVIQLTGRSRTADGTQTGVGTTVISTGVWSSVGGVLNFTGDTITPYYNGTAEGGGAVAFGVNTYADDGTPTASDMIGANTSPPSASANQFDGRIAEVAIWTVDIGAAGFAALAKGVSALLIRPEALAFYMPLIGNDSPERCRVTGLSGTITGTVAKADHPRLYLPARRDVRRFTTAAGGAPTPFRGLQLLGVGS